MKRIITIIVLLTIGFNLLAQTRTKKVKVTFGDELKVKKRTTLADIVGKDASGYYALKIKVRAFGNSDISLEHFNNRMHLTQSVPLDLSYNKKTKEYESILNIDDKLYLFSSFRNDDKKKKFLFVQTINKKTLSPNNDLKKIAEIDFSDKTKRNSGNFDYVVSRDSSKFLVYYNLPYDKGKPERFAFQVYDTKMNLLWEKELSLPYNDDLFDIEDYLIDNKGDVYLLGASFNEKRKTKRKGKPNYKYELLVYSDQAKQVEKHTISLDDKFITDMRVEILDNQNIACAGFYSDKGTFSIKGSYFMSLDADSKKIIKKSTNEFGIDFITQNMSKRKEKKAKKKAKKGNKEELFEYDLNKIVPKKNGGAYLIAEQYYYDSFTEIITNQQGITSRKTTYHYYYNDIIVINISAEGDIEWTEKIAKRQHTINDNGYYSSYALAYVDDKLYFIFNDNPKNMFLKEGDKIYNYNKGKKSIVTIVELTEGGEVTREVLFTKDDANVIVRTYVSEQMSNNEFVLFGDRKKKNQFFKLRFK